MVMDVKTEVEAHVLKLIRSEADKRYPRKLGTLARRLQWSRAKLSKVLTGEQGAKLPELLTLCSALALPLSHVLKVAGA